MLKIKDLSADLGEFSMENINLEVENGQYFVILGPTGAGKTVLLEVIAGIYSADSGEIVLNDQNITNKPPKDRPISMVYQDYMLFPHLTVEDNIKFGLDSEGYSNEEIEKRTKEAVELLEIQDILHRYPRTLSGGERQRATLARGLVMDPDVFLLDEPVSALDVPTQEKIIDELKKIYRETEITIIHVTHSREKAVRLGERIAIMKEGEIKQTGNSSKVFREPNSEFVANFVGAENIFNATSKLNNGTAKVKLKDEIEIEALSNREGKVKACIRPEEIMVSKTPIDSSGRNMLEGEIIEISERENTMQLKVDTGIELVVTITKKSYADMNLKVGEKIHLAFKATAVHLI
ncbi:MAG: ABC-type spermidine/putrescine transport system, ATPase component [Candidatus Methanohalarchaeum thermophilum]|uniref:Molybdate/tungstate import ATP-binding protein WtpC n=1 Tax=Methanohalarchaeum thermophilum TaxID=1903181 RepID=A0A1Q6DX47_METT1|nr:MAG: ABC-type spermidine/putrescine transport system, ATPase component [Candidatus Methanohalarchaeum thermophilum]